MEQCFLIAPAFRQGLGHVELEEAVVLVLCKCFAKKLDGLFTLAIYGLDDAHDVQRIEMPRLCLQHFFQVGLCLGHLSLLKQLDGLLKECRNLGVHVVQRRDEVRRCCRLCRAKPQSPTLFWRKASMEGYQGMWPLISVQYQSCPLPDGDNSRGHAAS